MQTNKPSFKAELATWRALLLKCGSAPKVATTAAKRYAAEIATRDARRQDTDHRGVRE